MYGLTAFLDANVLYAAALRDLLMRLALQGLFRPRWSVLVHEEWMAAVLQNFPDITRQQLERTRDLMNLYAKDSLVTGFEHQIETLQLPDPDDRHVLAAAIHVQATVIVTQNLKDFPQRALTPYGIEAQHPDVFIRHLMHRDLGAVVAAAHQHRANLKKPPRSVVDYLATLERQGLTQTVALLRTFAAVL